MPAPKPGFLSSICSLCLERRPPPPTSYAVARSGNLRIRRDFHQSKVHSLQNESNETTVRSSSQDDVAALGGAAAKQEEEEEEQGAMSRRLQEMTDEGLESSGRRAKKMIEESGFSEELKKRLEARIDATKFKAENQGAFSLHDMPASAGQGTREQAAALPWRGVEQLGDAALRMLDDAHKPLRGSAASKKVKAPPLSVDMRMKKAARSSAAERLANARDKTSIYALSQDNTMSEKEREEMRKMLRDRFQPGARPMPASIQGLQSLASERIEDAIARGLFRNIPRGKGVNIERDYTASSPFLDTTEYFMNKIIQKQEVLPPWVEKQQEVTRTAATFRSRLRADWKRHAARVIASKGGTLAEQVQRAEAYAAAERAANPNPRAAQTATETGIITKETSPPMPAAATATASSSPTVSARDAAISTPAPASAPPAGQATITITEEPPITNPATTPISSPSSPPSPIQTRTQTQPSTPPQISQPFRDPTWEATELSFHNLALTSLNNLTRSYNLMAPELAKKPYFNLRRELNNCFSDVAPQLASEIIERARRPPKKFLEDEEMGRGVFERFGSGGKDAKVKVWDSRRPKYGLKEFWRDLWTRKE